MNGLTEPLPDQLALSEVEGLALSEVEGPAPGEVEGPALSEVEGFAPGEDWIDAGRLFDEVVHRGTDPNALLAAEADPERTWEIVALPRSATPP